MDKEFNPDNYASFTIVASGWTFNVYSWQKAKAEFHEMRPGVSLYGTRHDGRIDLLKTK